MSTDSPGTGRTADWLERLCDASAAVGVLVLLAMATMTAITINKTAKKACPMLPLWPIIKRSRAAENMSDVVTSSVGSSI